MRKIGLGLIIGYFAVAVCVGAPDDATLSQRIVGEWQGGRHAVEYHADGTWRFAPAEGTTHGKWRIEDGKLIQTWELEGEAKPETKSYDILTLDESTLKFRDAEGTVFTDTRKPAGKTR